MPGVTVIRDGDLVAVLHQHWDEARQGAGARQGHLHAQRSARRQRHDLRSPREERAASSASRRAATRHVRGPAAAGVRTDVLRQLMAHARWNALAVRRSRTASHRGPHADAVPGEEPDHAGLEAPAEKCASSRLTSAAARGKSRRARRGGRAPRHAGRQARPRGVHTRGGFFYDTFRPASVLKIKSGLDSSGRIVTWEYWVYAAGERGAAQFYDSRTPHARVRHVERRGRPGYHPSRRPWAPPAPHQRLRARVAHRRHGGEGRIDPVEFRLKNLTDARMIRT